MPQPTLSGAHRICRFGGLALPNGQGTMPVVDLNDLSSWFLQDEFVADLTQQLTMAQVTWGATGAFLGADFGPFTLRLPMEYREGAVPLGRLPGALAAPFGGPLANLVFAGEQRLTFDNLTYIPARFQGLGGRRTSWRMNPLRWVFDLQLMCKDPWFRDISATTISNAALASGSATTFNVTYAGSVFALPVWTLTIPVGNTAPIQSFVLSNTMSAESLTIRFPGNLASATAWTITIDTTGQSVTDAGGRQYDFSGSFPRLYSPAGQVNAMSATLTPASGTATGCTIGGSVTNRWLL